MYLHTQSLAELPLGLSYKFRDTISRHKEHYLEPFSIHVILLGLEFYFIDEDHICICSWRMHDAPVVVIVVCDGCSQNSIMCMVVIEKVFFWLFFVGIKIKGKGIHSAPNSLLISRCYGYFNSLYHQKSLKSNIIIVNKDYMNVSKEGTPTFNGWLYFLEFVLLWSRFHPTFLGCTTSRRAARKTPKR